MAGARAEKALREAALLLPVMEVDNTKSAYRVVWKDEKNRRGITLVNATSLQDAMKAVGPTAYEAFEIDPATGFRKPEPAADLE